MSYNFVSIYMKIPFNEIVSPDSENKLTEKLILRITKDELIRIYKISEHFKCSKSRIAREGLWKIFETAEKMMRKRTGANFIN
jgi:hypothetical protein